MSQQKLADDLGLTRSQISSYESGTAQPNIKTLISIAFYFEITLEELILIDLTLLDQEPKSRTNDNQLEKILEVTKTSRKFYDALILYDNMELGEKRSSFLYKTALNLLKYQLEINEAFLKKQKPYTEIKKEEVHETSS